MPRSKIRDGSEHPRAREVVIAHDVLNEQVVIGAAAADHATMLDLVARVPADRMHVAEHRLIWEGFCELARRGLHFDPATLRLVAPDADVKLLAEIERARPEVPPNLETHVAALHWDHRRIAAAEGPVASLIDALRDNRMPPTKVGDLARAVADGLTNEGGESGFAIDYAEAIAKPRPAPRFFLRRLGFAEGRANLLTARAGTAKTFFGLDACIDVARGAPSTWGGLELGIRGRALYLDYEAGEVLTHTRAQRLAHAKGISLAQLGNRLGIATRPKVKLDSPEARTELRRACEGVALLFIDSLRVAAPRGKENDSEWRLNLDLVSEVCAETGTIAVVIHHEGRETGRGRGTTGLDDAAGASVSFARDADETITATPTKASMCAMPEPVSMRLRDVGEIDPRTGATRGIRIESADAPIGKLSKGAMRLRAILEKAAKPMSVRQVRAALGDVNQARALQLLSELRAADVACCTSDGWKIETSAFLASLATSATEADDDEDDHAPRSTR